ncbi:haloacid dehalogenase type II [Streptomyces niveus]|uniref:haloacid dehalogenase type II n=1 Tax=Streptomyces niveus TaxID=193462 RepID=UPI003869615E|nr:haloacid dehalogenase type II [Streptomyces niveus]
MADIRAVDIDAVVFDILGTLVDEPGGLRAEIRDALSASGGGPDGGSDDSVDELLAVWQRHVESEQRRIGQRERAYADSEVIDREAAGRVADRAGLTDPAAIERLATASRRLPAWGDSAAGLERLARRFPVLGLSNAAHLTLLHLNAYAGLRWHQILSGEAVLAYKPAPEVYGLAVDTAGCPPERVLMVAAHAWDLRGARARGMRTAYVRRPVGDPPTDADAFDGRFDGLEDLVNTLTAR